MGLARVRTPVYAAGQDDPEIGQTLVFGWFSREVVLVLLLVLECCRNELEPNNAHTCGVRHAGPRF